MAQAVGRDVLDEDDDDDEGIIEVLTHGPFFRFFDGTHPTVASSRPP